MKTKKKLLIALLSATCLTTGALGIAACGGADNYTDSSLSAIYQSEKDAGKTDKSYEEWLKDKLTAAENGNNGDDGSDGTDGKNGADLIYVAIIDGKIVSYYSDGSMVKSELEVDSNQTVCAITALDNKGNPVADVYLRLTYYDSANATTRTAAKAKTNANGVAYFTYTPVAGVSYKVKLADNGATEYDSPTPEGYSMVEDDYPLPEGATSLKIYFDDVRGTFLNAVRYNQIITVPYTREYNFASTSSSPAPIETNGTTNGQFTVNLTAGVYSYLCFAPYVKPETSTNADETADILNKALSASTGKYKITVTGGATMYYFAGSRANATVDSNGVPSIINNYTGDGKSNTTENSITINNESTSARGDKILGLISDKNVTVTITVERVDDAKELPEVTVKKVTVPTNLTKWAEKSSGETLTLMPITGAFTAVYNETDGYYHVNSASGPILLVTLTKTVSRFMEYSLYDYPLYANSENQGVWDDSAMLLNGTGEGDYDEDGNLLYKYDYNDVLKAYSALVNSDGVYGVDKTIYDMLNCLAASSFGIDILDAAKGYEWLLDCKYYAPEGGLAARGSGTTSDPYIIADGTNKIVISNGNSAVMTFNAPSAGVYTFKSTASISVTGAGYITVGDTVYVIANEAGETLSLTLTGTESNYSVTVGSSDTLSAYAGDGLSSSSGTNSNNAVSVLARVYCVKIDKSVNEDGVYIKFTTPIANTNATFAFQLVSSGNGNDCSIEINGTTQNGNGEPLQVSGLSYGDNVVVHVTADESEYLILRIYKVQ
jgi:hypothetical protein